MIAQPSDSTIAALTLCQVIQKKVQALPPDKQQSVLDFVEFLIQKTEPQHPQKSLWQVMDEASDGIPAEERDNMPSDGSYQHDHYLYGTPKREL